ncbi:hypothetical protein QBC40DRAFT_318481 [Triangularia verruculosa]|uniref:Uncharacterized protein n=1 Tax=Triangularia verruculosa TaxID=2587418 RepID=A0AAN6XR96_9PEZI|nr:hypothetical protein QBC40DRAFT_318481 [Triangularia verruculosa]
MSTVTRTWQEQERLRIEKEKENERIRLEQERERARIEREREAERIRVESERAQKESQRVASLRAAASRTMTTTKPAAEMITTPRTPSTTSTLAPPRLLSTTTTTIFVQVTTNGPRPTSTIRLSVIPIEPSPTVSNTTGAVACGQSGYFDCPPEYGGGCCPIGFACSKGDVCVSPQLENDKPHESLPCPGHKGYFACKEDIGGGCCPANYACIKDSHSQCRLSDSGLVFTNVDRLATRIAVPTTPPKSDESASTGYPGPPSPSETPQPAIGTPEQAVGIIVGGVMILVLYLLGSWLLFFYRQRRRDFRPRKSFRVLQVRSQWRDARAKARNELPTHHGMSELPVSTSRSGSPRPPLPTPPPPPTTTTTTTAATLEATKEKQVNPTHPLPPPPLQLRSPLSLEPQTPLTALSDPSPSATLSTQAHTLPSAVSALSPTALEELPPLLPPPSIPLPPTPTKAPTGK